MTVVGDLDELEASILDDDGDGGGAGVEAVLHQLLHRRRRPLNHLAGGDPVHHRRIETPDSRRFARARVRVWLVDFHFVFLGEVSVLGGRNVVRVEVYV